MDGGVRKPAVVPGGVVHHVSVAVCDRAKRSDGRASLMRASVGGVASMHLAYSGQQIPAIGGSAGRRSKALSLSSSM